MVPLDRWLRDYEFGARHAREVPVPPERAIELLLALPVAPDPVVRLLLGLRGIRASASIDGLRGVLGFEELERTATSLVAGACGRPWRPRSGSRPFTAAEPGTVRMAIAFWAEPDGRGARLVTETRVAPADDRARRAFARYWRVVGPFSALIRRRWLRAAARRAGAG